VAHRRGVYNDAAAGARNIIAREQLFRLGVGNLIVFALDVVRIIALYVISNRIPGRYVPIFVFEPAMGFWPLFKGLRPAIIAAD
jgi:hypothetical protein